MKNWFRIGDFPFTIEYPPEIAPPEKFMRFQCPPGESDYDYTIIPAKWLLHPEGVVVAQREDIRVYDKGGLERRLLGVKGWAEDYACYRETSPRSAEVYVRQDMLEELNIDPIFTSLLALERRLVGRQAMILHCAYTRYQGKAILFSAPSETGKTTQAGLWQKYRGSEVVNGDKALLRRVDGVWTACGWPVCGTSEVCRNEETPIRCIVMLSQGKTDTVRRLSPIQAFSQLYSQITVNGWNREAVSAGMALVDALVGEIPVYHLSCTISENAVRCLEEAIEKGEEL